MSQCLFRRWLAISVVWLPLIAPALAGAKVVVVPVPDTRPEDQMSRAELLAAPGYYPASCLNTPECILTGPGGEVWVWEAHVRNMARAGKTLLFRGKCMSACYYAYLAALAFKAKGNPVDLRIAPGTVFYKHTPYRLRQ